MSSNRSHTSVATPGSRSQREPFVGPRLTIKELERLSEPLKICLHREALDEGALASIRAVAVLPGQPLARWPLPSTEATQDDILEGQLRLPLALNGESVDSGRHVELMPAGDFRARQYGYLCLSEGQLCVLSPLRLSHDAMHLHWVVVNCQPHVVTGEMIMACVQALGVTGQIDMERVERLCLHLRQGVVEPGVFEIAAGIESRRAGPSRGQILADVERRAGSMREDGSIDFRHVNFAPTVSADQLVARIRPPIQATAGCDLLGNVLVADDEAEQTDAEIPLRAGDNIRTQMQGTTEEFYATIDGLLRRSDDGVLSVSNTLTVRSDVSFDTGNLSFDGEIFIDGSVIGGFTVASDDSVTISGTIEPGCSVTSKGNITIGAGIVGERTKVSAGGNVRAQFVQEACVVAGGDIDLGSFAYRAQLHAGGTITVVNGSGQRRGSIIGGETWAQAGINIRTAGSATGTETRLVTGLTPEQADQLDKIIRATETSYQHVLRILRQFGLTCMDVVQIRNLIKASAGPHRRLLARRARQLGKLVQAYQTLMGSKDELQHTIAQESLHARLQISDTAHAGVVVRIGEHQRVLTADIRVPCFHIDDNQLVER